MSPQSLLFITLTVLVSPVAQSAPILSEVVADNESGLADEEGDLEDWIEICNTSSTAQDLSGWHLSDDPTNRLKWAFPAGTSIPAGGYLVVFASKKDRAVAGETLHTNFKLDADGEELSLSDPSGTLASSLTYLALGEDVSFGPGYQKIGDLVTPASPSKLFIPTDNSLNDTWKNLTFDDSSWINATTSIGYDDGTPDASGNGPLGFWDFNDATSPTSAPDASGNGHTGAITTATYTADLGGRSGQPGDRAMDFGAINNGATIKINDAANGFLDPSF
ncbi:lamin tail domain-containing protein, partial [Akkermansiaceae bacterium]|nr:lamin tail domain-containing protein [Akkermansiaceae bacterium]